MHNTKSILRSLYLGKRLSLSTQEFSRLNKKIFANLINMDLSSVRVISIFTSLARKREPLTLEYIKWLSENKPAIELITPKINFKTHCLDCVKLNNPQALRANRFGILEPVDNIYVDKQTLDIVFVPLLCIDSYGNRVGYGKGFYDKFLAQCSKKTKKIGISLFEPVAKIDSEEHDMKLNQCITPSGVVYFG